MLPSNEVSYVALQKSPVTESTESVRSRPEAQEQPVQWRISLWTPSFMLGLLVAGIFVSGGHHVLYSRLNGTTVRDSDDGSQYLTQTWIIRYGTAFAFLSKTLLASAVVVAYKQYMWINLRSRANAISTIDAMFAATHDAYAVLSPSLLFRAKLPAIMALITWLLPIAALVTPSTLVVVPSTRYDVTMMYVPTLDFNDTSLYMFNGFGDGTSPLITRLTSAMASNMEVMPMRAVAPNTTYQHKFVGPSLKCEVATGKRLDRINSIWEATADVKNEDLMYLSFTLDDSSDGWISQLTPSIFVAQCVKGSAYDLCNAISGPIVWARLRNETITCSVYVTRFNLEFSAMGMGNSQIIQSMQFEWLDSIEGISTTTNSIYRAISQALVTMLNGSIRGVDIGTTNLGGPTNITISLFTERTRIMSTALIGLLSSAKTQPWIGATSRIQQADRDLAANRTLADMIEELSRNQTLSFFSSDRLWLPQNATNTTAVTQSITHTIYEYRPRNLFITYSIAVFFSTLSVLLGLRAVWLNGICHDTSFSSIVSTTRSSFLDELTLGNSLGVTPTPSAISDVKLRFGELRDGGDGARSRAGFGLDESTMPLKKGQVIY